MLDRSAFKAKPLWGEVFAAAGLAGGALRVKPAWRIVADFELKRRMTTETSMTGSAGPAPTAAS